jgi:hypothetical protein
MMNVTLQGEFSAVVKTRQGAYLIGWNDIYYFDGSNLRSVGKQIIQGTDNLNFDRSFGTWDYARQELVIVIGDQLLCYQEPWDTWYTRTADFDSATIPVTAITAYPGKLVVGLASLKLRKEDTVGDQAPVYDSTNGTAFGKPYMVTQILGDNLIIEKEMTGVFLGAGVDSTGISATYYTTGNNATVQISYWLTPNGNFVNVSEVIDATATWTQANADGWISLPRVPFRGIALGLEIQGTAAKPAKGVTIHQIVPQVYTSEQDVQR